MKRRSLQVLVVGKSNKAVLKQYIRNVQYINMDTNMNKAWRMKIDWGKCSSESSGDE